MENNCILVLDDEPKIQDIFRDILTGLQSEAQASLLDQEAAFLFGSQPSTPTAKPKKNFQLTLASQGQEGLELVKKSLAENNPFAVGFIDVRMPPGWDGIKTAAEIRKLDKDMEIVIVTAYADKTLDEILEAVAMPERLLYIKKPFMRDEIWQLANALSAKWNLQVREKFYREGLEGIISTFSQMKNVCPVDMITLLKYILRQIAKLCGSKDAFFFFANNLEGNFNLEYRFGTGRFETDEAINEIFQKYKLADNLINIRDNQKGFYKIEDLVIVPFRLEEKKYIFAAVVMECAETEEHKRILEVFAENALIALQNARLYQNLEQVNLNLEQRVREQTEELRVKTEVFEKLAKIDLLTGLYNHASFFELLDKAYQESIRYKLDLACAMVDLDNFKITNDKYGHLVGDKVLVSVSALLRESSRVCDILGRYGGDEFAIVFTNTNLDNAQIACERMRQKLESLKVTPPGEGEVPITMTGSFGISSLNLKEPVTSEKLMQQADEAMYEAKKAGRNCVYLFKK